MSPYVPEIAPRWSRGELRCAERLNEIPTTSDHLFPADERRGIPTGKCLKCGLPLQDWLARSTAAYQEMTVTNKKEKE